ncbi:MAG: DUF1574 domain-containing protein [Moorea sp. SIO2B7]|nr:DUF1574 domain-containing protein [Moorena sp. SIO2B7]
MLDLEQPEHISGEQRHLKNLKSPLQNWVYQAIAQAVGNSLKLRLRVRLRGNNLHILCESSQITEAQVVVQSLVEAIKAQSGCIRLLSKDSDNPIYQIILYGRAFGQKQPDWIKRIVISHLDSQTPTAISDSNSLSTKDEKNTSTALISNQTLARSGSPDAIARHLSDRFSHLGVSIRVTIQQPKKASVTKGEANLSTDRLLLKQRLWVFINCDYSPEPSLLAEPIAQELRDLGLYGFKEAVICSTVSGESTPDWVLRVDLTHPDLMLKEWAQWGDLEAISRLLNRTLVNQHLQVRTILKEMTIHIFCSLLPSHPGGIPDKEKVIKTIADLFETITPQGIKGATIYCTNWVKTQEETTEEDEDTTPVSIDWIDWLNLAAATVNELALSPLELAKGGNQDALIFLLQRAVNYNLDWRLTTGGIRLKIKQKSDLMHICSESVICPSKAQVFGPIEQLLRELALAEIAGIRIYGRRSGQSTPQWTKGVDFVKRKASISKAAPNFAPTDVELNNLTMPTTEEETIIEPEVEVNENNSKDFIKVVSQTIQSLLCASGLFIQAEEELDHTLARANPKLEPNNLSSYRRLKVALVWATLGILLTLQVDWLFGRLLQSSSVGEVSNSVTSKAIAEPPPPEAVSLPELSLQKSWDSENFNPSQFTEDGETIIISEVNSRDDNRSRRATAAILAAARSSNPSFNNRLLDEKLALYQERVQQNGPPDVIIIGSSRAMRGVDPFALQKALIAQGYPELEIFNFGINGATAKVVDLIIRQILTPEELPKLIIFADGARAFNSGRKDLTYRAITNSEGYQELLSGTFPRSTNIEQDSKENSLMATAASEITKNKGLTASYKSIDKRLNKILGSLSLTYSKRENLKNLLQENFLSWFNFRESPTGTELEPEEIVLNENNIDFEGFLSLSIRFDPDTYYQNHPKVSGAYDSDYTSFQLYGDQHQALLDLVEFLNYHDVELVVVNQPLTDQYLDRVRSKYEQEFSEYMHKMALEKGLIFRDLGKTSLQEYSFFSDPSHLNRYGAYFVSLQLAKDSMINWPIPREK